MVDMVFSAGVVAAITVFIAPLIEREGKVLKDFYTKKERHSFAALVGLCVLSKGPLGVVLPILVVSSLLLLRFRILEIINFLIKPDLSWAIFFLIATPWYFLAYLEQPEGFLERQLFFENIERALGGKEVNTQAIWYYIPSLLRTTSPWSFVALLFVLYKLWRKEPFELITKMALIWLLSGMALFSLASGKRHSYLLPLYPPLVLIIVPTVKEWLSKLLMDDKRECLRNFARVMIILLSIFLMLTLMIVLMEAFNFDLEALLKYKTLSFWLTDKSLIFLNAALIALLACFMVRRDLLLTLSLAMVAIFVLAVSVGAGIKNSMRDYWRIAASIDRHISSQDRLFALRPMHNGGLDPILFYLKSPAQPVLDNLCHDTKQGDGETIKLLVDREYLYQHLDSGQIEEEKVKKINGLSFYHAYLNEIERYFIEAHTKSRAEEFILFEGRCFL
jgi:4-amino-4-deoxy-L-arabinose transferase-like glycosyltransferase